MRLYETSFLIAPTLPEEEAEKLIEKMVAIISEKNGKMINVDNWGKKRLAYPIKKFEDAVYVFFLYKGEIDIPVELERNFKQTESVIRFLTIKLEERDNIRRTKKGTSRSQEPPRGTFTSEKKPEEKTPGEEKSHIPIPEEKPKLETTAEETKRELKVEKKEEKKAEEEPKEEKKIETKEEKKEELKIPAKKTEETKDRAPIKKPTETEKEEETEKEKEKEKGPKKEAAPEKEGAAVKEEKEK